MGEIKSRRPKRFQYMDRPVTRTYPAAEVHSQNHPQKTDPQPPTDPKTPKDGFFKRNFLKIPLVVRTFVGVAILILLAELILPVVSEVNTNRNYDISNVEGTLLNRPIDFYADKLVFDHERNMFVYNEGYMPGGDVGGQSYAPKITAELAGQEEGITVYDPVNEVSLKMAPNFNVGSPQKNKNRVVYPIDRLEAKKVYTLQGSGVKEDIILDEFQGNELEFEYNVETSSGTEMRVESDGSLAVYGVSSVLLGNVSTGTEEDAKLLDNARQNGKKTTLLFRIPKPVVLEGKQKLSEAKAEYVLNGDTLTIKARDLGKASYPLSIDPSVYVETARKLMRGNNETNIDFDTTNELITKGFTTGARFDSWDNTTQLNDARWNGGSDVAGGFIYYAGGSAEGGLVSSEFTTAGNTTYNVPAGVTAVTVKIWGAGGGGGGSSNDRDGGAGGGGGYVSSTLTVTPSETLTVYVGGGGGGGTGSSTTDDSGNGGGGGGYSALYRSTTPLLVAAGGGGGGGANGDTGNTARQPGDDAGAGGGTAGITGDGNGDTTGGSGGTPTAGGSGGTVGGSTGASLTGGEGGGDGTAQNNGGTNGGGDGGTQQNGGGPNKRPGGGGGGAGYYGGGGGGQRNSRYNGGAGGGGGSSYTTGSPTTNVSGTGTDPGNKNDTDRGGVGDGGAGGVSSGGNGTAGDDGKVIISYSTGGAGAVSDDVYWAELNESTGTVDSPNPGDGTCTNWCNLTAYNLPAERQGHTVVAYNGFLYVFGGEDDDVSTETTSTYTTSGVRQSTVYIAKLGANGEPQLWHPTDTDPDNWVYWYTDTALPSERAYHSAVAYNGKMYLLGGQTNSSTGGITTVHMADIQPHGILGTWTTTGTTVLPSARYGHSVHVYNDYMYLIGGNSSGTLQATVHYNKIDTSDGSMGTWYSTKSFADARMTWGGKYTTIWGGYLYLQGGCSAVNGTSGYCTTIEDDTQLASINADGTITAWDTIVGQSNIRTGHSLTAWRGYIYGIGGGCTTQNSIDGGCSDLVLTNDYGTINQDGDASTVSDSVNIGTGVCSGSDPYDCDTPPLGNNNGEGGQMAGGVVINNGHVYYIGGCRVVSGSQICTNGSASRTADTIYYAEISNDGTLRRSPGCDTTDANIQYAGSWCVDNRHTINGSTGLAAFGYTVFDNTIYVIGGTDGKDWQTTVYRNALNADGTLNNWSSQTQSSVGLGTTSIGYPFVFARANPSSAGTNPGNLYVVGGCSNGSTAGLDCGTTASNYMTTVYKCNITTSGTLASCSTSGQVQIDSEPSTSGNQGLGIAAGTVYANYIYLIGGQSPNESERGQVMYAKIDNNNDIIDVDDETVTDNIWETSPNEIDPARRRGMAFGYNGYLYALAGFAVDTGLNDLLFAKIDVSDGSIGVFTESGVTVNQRWDLRGVVSSGYVYTLGGCSSGSPPATCNGMTATVQTFQLYNNFSGSTSDYDTAGPDFGNGSESNSNRIGSSAAVVNGYIYMAGGCHTATDCTDGTDDVQYATLNEDGSINTWTNASNILPGVRAWGQLETVGGDLYYLGGQTGADSTAQSTVYYVTPSGTGNITSSWSTASGGIGDTGAQAAQARTEFSATIWNDRIYVVGGYDGSAVSDDVYISPDLSSGGNIAADAWTEDTDVPDVARRGHTLMSYGNNLYIFGGYDGTNYLNDVQFASIGYKTGTISQTGTTVTGTGTSWTSSMVGSNLQYSDGNRATVTAFTSATSITVDVDRSVTAGSSYIINDGSVGEWSFTTSLPQKVRNADGFARNGYIYLFGGRSANATCTDNTYITPISANTDVASGNNPTGIGAWYQTREALDGNDRYGATAVYYQGRAYIFGGGCDATLTYTGADRTLHATLFSQPQVARYSRMIDTDTDVFPTKWLLNGIDNDVGARWNLSYRTMHDLDSEVNPNEDCGTSATMATMTTWGQNTNFGEVTLGDPEDYTPKNDSGGDINCARYFYFAITIDSSQAYGYPDDVDRGPTIDDLSLFFTSDPNKRLRHGKTFTGGEQQPLDTPF